MPARRYFFLPRSCLVPLRCFFFSPCFFLLAVIYMCASAVENSDAAVTVDTRAYLFFFFLQRWRMWADLGRGPPCFIFRMFGARAGAAATDSRRGFGEWGDENGRKKKLSALFFVSLHCRVACLFRGESWYTNMHSPQFFTPCKVRTRH